MTIMFIFVMQHRGGTSIRYCKQPVGNGQMIQKNTKQYPSMRTNHFFQQILILQVSHSASGTLLHKEEAAASQSHNDGWWLKGKKNLRNNWVFSAFLQDENNSYLANLAEASFIAAKFYLNSSIFTMFGALPPVHHVFVGRGTYRVPSFNYQWRLVRVLVQTFKVQMHLWIWSIFKGVLNVKRSVLGVQFYALIALRCIVTRPVTITSKSRIQRTTQGSPLRRCNWLHPLYALQRYSKCRVCAPVNSTSVKDCSKAQI